MIWLSAALSAALKGDGERGARGDFPRSRIGQGIGAAFAGESVAATMIVGAAGFLTGSRCGHHQRTGGASYAELVMVGTATLLTVMPLPVASECHHR